VIRKQVAHRNTVVKASLPGLVSLNHGISGTALIGPGCMTHLVSTFQQLTCNEIQMTNFQSSYVGLARVLNSNVINVP